MNHTDKLTKLAKGVASIYYLAPSVWFSYMAMLGKWQILKMTLGLWYLNADSKILLGLGRAGFVIAITFSTAVGLLILIGKSFAFRRVAYADAIFIAFYLIFICIFFSLPDKVTVVENFLIARVCLLPALWDETQKRNRAFVAPSKT